MNMTIAKTRYYHRHSRKVTWITPDGVAKKQIDLILIDRSCVSSINWHKIRPFPGADIGTDHNLIMTSIKVKLKIKKGSSTRLKYNIHGLRDQQSQQEFPAKIGGKF